MSPHTNDDSDWSDSDDDDRSDLETSVLLGVPDGALERQQDVDDAAVSRVGGRPAFLPRTEPLLASSQCKNCSFPMQLLVQLWCPFEGSTMDRALYIFGCARDVCLVYSDHAGTVLLDAWMLVSWCSVRAFRGLRFNAAYAAKLEKKIARQSEKEVAKTNAKKCEDHKKAAAKINPFSMKASPISSGLFSSVPAFGGADGLGSQLFSDDTEEETEEGADEDDVDVQPPSDSESEHDSEAVINSDKDDANSLSDESILAAPASTPSAASPWSAAPKYAPLYLSTVLEYLPPPPKVKTSKANMYDDETGGKSRKAEKKREEQEEKIRAAWEGAVEGYEDSMEIDKVFERFARRVGYEGEQCIRYELGGTPLPYAHDALFAALFPSPTMSSSVLAHAKATFVIQPQSKVEPARRTYDERSAVIAPCTRCGGRRIFECQLMPHLISVLRDEKGTQSSDETKIDKKDEEQEKSIEARKQEVESLLRSGGSKRGMEWGTCMVFSCERDCCLVDGKEADEAWIEELILAQWEE